MIGSFFRLVARAGLPHRTPKPMIKNDDVFIIHPVWTMASFHSHYHHAFYSSASPLPSLKSSTLFGFFGQRRNMFNQSQPLMFYLGKPVMEVGSADFPNARSAMNSPLAKSLFEIDGVTRVFFGSDFVTVTKSEESSWEFLKPEIFAAITDFYSSGQPLFLDSKAAAAMDIATQDDDSGTVAMIKELLETRIRLAVQDDGGDIHIKYGGLHLTAIGEIRTIKEHVVGAQVRRRLRNQALKICLMYYVPEVKKVFNKN